MSKVLKYVSIALIAFSIFLIFPQSPIQAAPISLKFAFELPLSHPWGQGAIAFKEYVEEKTNKEITIELYPAGQLGKSSEDVQQGVMLRNIDIGISSTPIVLLNPIQKIFDLPFVFATREEAWAVLDGETGQLVAEKLEKSGLKSLAYWEDGFRQVTNNVKPIQGPDDFKGLKIRVPYSPQRIETFNNLGSRPTAMPFSEVFSALEQGVIDGQENPLTVIWNSSLYDVQKFITVTNHVYSPANLLINLSVWNSLSEDQKGIISEAALIGQKVNRDLNAEGDESLLAELQKKGMVVNYLSKEDVEKIKVLVKPVWDAFVKDEGEEAKTLLEKVQDQISKM